MTLWVALFRGINVGGHNIVPMKELVALLDESGCQDVATYIQSGNVVFRHDAKDAAKLETVICDNMSSKFGFEPKVVLLPAGELLSIARNNPFPDAEQHHKTLHLFFLTLPSTEADIDALDALIAENEDYDLTDRVLYLHAPDGIGRSKLAAKVEKLLGVPATARNWRTVSKLVEMTNRIDA